VAVAAVVGMTPLFAASLQDSGLLTWTSGWVLRALVGQAIHRQLGACTNASTLSKPGDSAQLGNMHRLGSPILSSVGRERVETGPKKG
jgi:hypothetical protein